MRKRFSALFSLMAAICAVILCDSADSLAQTGIDSQTIFQFFKADLPGGEERVAMPGYEYLRVEMGNFDAPGVSAHFYGWGRYDFGNYFKDESEASVLYGYLQYKGEENGVIARFGRQYIFEGASGAALDGLYLDSQLGPFFSVSGFIGQPVALETASGRDGDSIVGGRLSHHLGSYYDLGLSYKRTANDLEVQEELLGVDSSFTFIGRFFLNGKSVMNQRAGEWQFHDYTASLGYGIVTIKPFFQSYSYDAFFDTGETTAAPFSDPLGGLAPLKDSGEKVRIIGADFDWHPVSSILLGAKFKNYDYEVRPDPAKYVALIFRRSFSGLSEGGFEAGRMDGGVDEDTYSVIRAHGYYEASPIFLFGEAVYSRYGEQIYGDKGDDESVFLSFGAGTKLLKDSLTLKASGDYSKNPNYEMDIRGQFSLEYSFRK